MMDDFFERFCEQVSRILDARDVFNCKHAIIDTIANKMDANVNVLHFGVVMRIMSAYDSSLIVARHNGRSRLGKAKFFEQRTKPDDLMRAMCAGDVFSLARRKCDDGLLF